MELLQRHAQQPLGWPVGPARRLFRERAQDRRPRPRRPGLRVVDLAGRHRGLALQPRLAGRRRRRVARAVPHGAGSHAAARGPDRVDEEPCAARAAHRPGHGGRGRPAHHAAHHARGLRRPRRLPAEVARRPLRGNRVQDSRRREAGRLRREPAERRDGRGADRIVPRRGVPPARDDRPPGAAERAAGRPARARAGRDGELRQRRRRGQPAAAGVGAGARHRPRAGRAGVALSRLPFRSARGAWRRGALRRRRDVRRGLCRRGRRRSHGHAA